MKNGGEMSRGALWRTGTLLVLVCSAALCAAEAETAPVVSETGAMVSSKKKKQVN